MEKKSKSSGLVRNTFFRVLGTSRSKAFLSFLIKKRQSSQVHFPVDISSVKEILLILPEQRLEVLYQLRNVMSLTALFKHAGVSFFCEHEVASIVKMVPGVNIIEYDEDDRIAFSSSFTSLAHQFRDSIDICFLLDRNPELPVLYFTGSTAAPIRAGYQGAGEYPFLNLRINPSPNRKFLPEVNCSMAEMFGARSEKLRWGVAKKTLEEIDHLMRETKIARGVSLIGIDALFFLREFGSAWTEQLVQALRNLNKGELYFYVENGTGRSDLTWLQNQSVPLFSDLSASRTAALLTRSGLIFTGNTALYAFIDLLRKPAIGFFRQSEIDTFCPQSSLLKGIPYQTTSDTGLIERAIQLCSGVHLR